MIAGLCAGACNQNRPVSDAAVWTEVPRSTTGNVVPVEREARNEDVSDDGERMRYHLKRRK